MRNWLVTKSSANGSLGAVIVHNSCIPDGCRQLSVHHSWAWHGADLRWTCLTVRWCLSNFWDLWYQKPQWQVIVGHHPLWSTSLTPINQHACYYPSSNINHAHSFLRFMDGIMKPYGNYIKLPSLPVSSPQQRHQQHLTLGDTAKQIEAQVVGIELIHHGLRASWLAVKLSTSGHLSHHFLRITTDKWMIDTCW